MKRTFALVSTLAWSLVVIFQATGTVVGAELQTSNPMVLSGEVIVKFGIASDVRRTVFDAAPSSAELDARLARLASLLSKQLSVPLRISQITSGQELVLSIDAEDVVSKVVEHLNRRDDVKLARRVRSGDAKGLVQPNPRVMVKLVPGSEVADSQSEAVTEMVGRSVALQTLIETVEDDVGVKLSMNPPHDDEIDLVVHIDSLTSELVGRLRDRADVEYAQPNFVLQHFGNSGIGAGGAVTGGSSTTY